MYVLHKPWDETQIPFRKFDGYLPYVPSKQETWNFISSIPDLKQRVMVTLLYSSGLRIGELCRLRYEDVERRNMRLHITHGKNRSDRYAIFSKAAFDLLTIKALMGHKSLHSATVYVHLASNGTLQILSPFDRLAGEYYG